MKKLKSCVSLKLLRNGDYLYQDCQLRFDWYGADIEYLLSKISKCFPLPIGGVCSGDCQSQRKETP